MALTSPCVVTSVVFSVLLQYCVDSHQDILLEETAHMESLHAPSGGRVELPCDVTSSLQDDRMVLVIWYKQGHDTPIYTFDSREDSTSHWSEPMILGQRALFKSDTNPATLVLNKLRPEDSGQYRCRVDFIKSPTKNTRLNLTILIPAEKLMVLDSAGDEIKTGVIGPYDEGTMVNLTCVAIGGRPIARVSWWKTHVLLANSEARASVNFTLERSDLGSEISCQAVTDPSIPPLSKTLSIDINLRPLLVRIQGSRRPLVAGQSTELVCQVVGARPKPSISWWKGGIRMKSIRETMSADGNITNSILTFTPSLDDMGKVISCRAIQTLMPHSTQEDGFKMEIQYVPVTKIELGASLDASNIIEGSDVYLDCRVRANPPHHLVYFTRNGAQVKSGPGVLLANQSLVLQKVSRRSAGTYICFARNSLGDGSSQELVLNVKYAPTCRSTQMSALRAAKGDIIEIQCSLDSNPKDEMSYDWWFNSSTHSRHELVSSSSQSPGTYSYTVNTSSDYGWVQCFGTNTVGRQVKPCLFHIVPADKPSPVKKCEVSNVTYDSLSINCTAGLDGGIRQYFLLELFDMRTGSLLANVTNEAPEFCIVGLTTSNNLSIKVRAFNKKGSSEPVNITSSLLKYPERHTAEVPVKIELTTVFLVVLGAIGVVAFTTVILATIYCVSHYLNKNKSSENKKPQEESSSIPLTGTNESKSIDSMEMNPDIIPLDYKVSENDSNASTSTDYSTRPLISKFPSEKYDSFPPPNCDIYSYNHSQDPCSQFIQIRPLEYRARPSHLEKYPSFRQNLMPMPSLVRMTPNECHVRRMHDKVYGDRLKYDPAFAVNTGGSLLPDQLLPQPFATNHPLQGETLHSSLIEDPFNFGHNMQESETHQRSELNKSGQERSCSASPPVRFNTENNSIYFNKVLPNRLNETNTLPYIRRQVINGSTYHPHKNSTVQPINPELQEQIVNTETINR